MNINEKLSIRVSSGVLHQQIGQETVLLHPDSDEYFGLDAVGTRCWELLSSGVGIADIIAMLLEEYDVERSVLERDLERLLEALLDAGLVVVEDQLS
jgi:hypothetical protein